MRSELAVLLVTSWLGSGCFSLGLDAPQLTPAGQNRISVGGDTLIGSPNLAPTDRVSFPSIAVAAGYRRGFQSWDLGVRAWGMGIPDWYGVGVGADVRYGFVSRLPTEPGWSVTGRLGVSYHQIGIGGTPTHYAGGDLTVSTGYRFPGFLHMIYLAVRGHVWGVFGRDLNPQALGAIAGSFGWEAQFGRDKRWAILPQVGGGYIPVSWNGTLDDPDRNGLPFLQLTLAARVHL